MAVRYLALGDSYTIGTGASNEAHNYPSILAAHLSEAAGRRIDVTNPAVNGFTTHDLIENELPYLGRVHPQLVSILIGVNDIVQGQPPDEYRKSMVEIYRTIEASGVAAGNVAAISIPNWSVVPSAPTYGDPGRLRTLTDSFNESARQEAVARGFRWVDIGAVSTSGLGSPGWVSSDQLHPGDAQYAAWAELIWEALRDQWTAGGLAARP